MPQTTNPPPPPTQGLAPVHTPIPIPVPAPHPSSSTPPSVAGSDSSTSTNYSTSGPSSEPRITGSSVPLPTVDLLFPNAGQPDIIRANQKDSYYQMLLQQQVTDVARQFLGSRRQHVYQQELNVFSDFCYHALTTLLGSQTLGEEYCDILQVSTSTQAFPGIIKRSSLVFWHVLVPYLYTRGFQELRKRTKPAPVLTRHQLFMQEQQRKRSGESAVEEKKDSEAMIKLKTTIHNWLPSIQNFLKTHGHSAHLALFYFMGSYYSLSKRITGIRYIFNRKLAPGEERSGYELLGVLIVIQLVIQFYQHRKAKAAENQALALTASLATASATLATQAGNETRGLASAEDLLDRGIEIQGEKMQNKNKQEVEEEEEEEEEEEDLSGKTTAEINARKCTLCLDPRTNTTATPCGHLFCWTCIREWCQNKPECPLCRQNVQLSNLLPIYTKLY